MTGCELWEWPPTSTLTMVGILPLGAITWPTPYAWTMTIFQRTTLSEYDHEITLETGDRLWNAITFQRPNGTNVMNIIVNRGTPHEIDWHQSFLTTDFCRRIIIPWRQDGFDHVPVAPGPVTWQLTY